MVVPARFNRPTLNRESDVRERSQNASIFKLLVAATGGLLWLYLSPLLFVNSIAARPLAHPSNVVCRPEMPPHRRAEVADKLREITGWDNLRFDDAGFLHPGATTTGGGSPSARALLGAAVNGAPLLVLEDASHRDDVVFCRVVPGRWTDNAAEKPPVHLLLIDFADFSHVRGDPMALSAFNVGWGVLHEMAHVVYDAADAAREDEAGECEELLNRMRRECGKAERAEYYFRLFPGAAASEFKTRYVRLAFEHSPIPNRGKKRYWLIWDAAVVGGLRASR